jgi:predicted patatin/cPLA2 family phospholipase
MGHNPDELQRVYDIGVRDGKRQIAAMKRWMEG